MPNFVRFSVFLILAALLTTSPATCAPLRSGTVTVHTQSGDHIFKIEVAETEEAREQGLMYRHALDKDSGMIFLYEVPESMAMWMKNTLIPLDMLFIRRDGTIANIRERAVPGSLETIPSAGPVSAALELNGGTVARLGIKPGDKVIGEGLGQ